MAVTRTVYLTATAQSIGLPVGFIQGILIDNPTASWLRIDPMRELCPPFTWGWSRDLPNEGSVSVTFLGNSPSGSVSGINIVTTAKVEVTITGAPVGNSDGQGSGAGFQQANVPKLLSKTLPYSTGAAQTTFITVSAATRRIILRRVILVPDLTYGIGQVQHFGAPILVHLADSTVPLTDIWYQSISPETPYADSAFEDGAVQITTGANLLLTGNSEFGSPQQGFIVLAQYYEASSVAV